MDQMKRHAISYSPRSGAFADAAARWLGWDLAQGPACDQPGLPGLAADTADPRKYGFHGTVKAPFRLADGAGPADLHSAGTQLATGLTTVQTPGLQMSLLDGFLALIPQGDTAGLQTLAAQVMQALKPFRAPLTEAEVLRRRPGTLTPRQRDPLSIYGYPFVLEQFQFHLTLSGRLTDTQAAPLTAAATAHFAGLIPQPFVLQDICLCGEVLAGRFHLLHRYPLSA